MTLGIFIKACIHQHSTFYKIFIVPPPKKTRHTISLSVTPPPPGPQPQATTNLFSVSVDTPVLDSFI